MEDRGNQDPDGPSSAAIRWRVARFVGFVLLGLSVSFAFWGTELFTEQLRPASLEQNARLAAAILRGLGEHAVAQGSVLTSPKFAVQVGTGCDALLPFVLCSVVILGSPVSLATRCIGIVAAAAGTLALNQVRIVSLYFTGVHFPAAFDLMHREVWQVLFVAGGLVGWVGWALWALRFDARRT